MHPHEAPGAVRAVASVLTRFALPMPDAPPATVWIVEDDAGYRDAVAAALGPSVRETFDSVEDALTCADVAQELPEVLLLDINLPGLSGLDGIAMLKARLPSTRVVMLTIRDEPEAVYAALGAGASGYLLKSVGADAIADAVETARQGGMWMPAPVARLVLDRFAPAAQTVDYGLTERERDVLAEMTRGGTQREIADRLFVSVSTVNTHVQNVYAKLHVRTASAAVAKAVREGLVERV